MRLVMLLKTMKQSITEGITTETAAPPAGNKYKFEKVLDRRKQPIRGLWSRNGKFYGQVRVAEKGRCQLIPLLGKDGLHVSTVPQATVALQELLKQKRDGALVATNQSPLFRDYAERYLDWAARAKSRLTIKKERGHLAKLNESLGGLRLNRIQRSHINDHLKQRVDAGASPRTANIDIVVLRNCLNHAIGEHLLGRLPTENLKPLKHVTPKRPFRSREDIEKICETAFSRSTSGRPMFESAEAFVDVIRVMCQCGSRIGETLALRWEDVDFEGRRVTFTKTKYGKPRTVPLSKKLFDLLTAMHERRLPTSQWVFPTRFPGMRGDNHLTGFYSTLRMVREKANMPDFWLHDCRHYFISQAVMQGVDYMTIASWVGHADGGVLIGRVYGHLSDKHSVDRMSGIDV